MIPMRVEPEGPAPAAGDVGDVDAALAGIRAVVERQLGVARPQAVEVDTRQLVRFSVDLAETLSPEERANLGIRAQGLDPWLQGPFLLGGDLVVGGAWRSDQRWSVLDPEVDRDLAGRRVLDVGSNAGYDAFSFRLRGADVVACEPWAFFAQALFLESVYRSGVRFENIGWQQLDSEVHGTFDIIHCNGVLYHEPHPVALLQRLRS
ncbi:MAG: DUF1698 domain-containing protein, partial [Candidatus Dormibacteria bacterium]